MEETNFFKLFLQGFRINLELFVEDSKREVVTSFLAAHLREAVQNPQLRFLLATLKSAAVRIKLSQEDTLGLLMDFLDHVGVEAPDGADLIDAVGFMLDSEDFHYMVGEVPHVSELVDALKQLGKCDISLGYSQEKASAKLLVRMDGVKELYENVMAGMSK